MKQTKKEGVSLIVLSLTIIIMVIFTSVIIITISSTNMVSESDNVVLETNRQQIEDLANSAWVKAYNEGKVTQPELQLAVEEMLGKEKINTDKYDISVTVEGVTVTIKE